MVLVRGKGEGGTLESGIVNCSPGLYCGSSCSNHSSTHEAILNIGYICVPSSYELAPRSDSEGSEEEEEEEEVGPSSMLCLKAEEEKKQDDVMLPGYRVSSLHKMSINHKEASLLWYQYIIGVSPQWIHSHRSMAVVYVVLNGLPRRRKRRSLSRPPLRWRRRRRRRSQIPIVRTCLRWTSATS